MDKNAKSKNYIMAIATFPVICITTIIASAWMPRIISIIDTAPLNRTQTRQSNAYIFAPPGHYPRRYPSHYPRYYPRECAKPSETKETQIILKRNPLKTFSISEGGKR
jgi:hypothetical protein